MRLQKLYQVPNFDADNAVYLAEWVYDNYQWEDLDTIMIVLKSPPPTQDERGNTESNWRLTPDRIQRWMAVILEKKAADREAEHQKMKNSESKEPLPEVNYEEFKKRLAEGNALREVKSDPWLKGDDAYSKFRADRLRQEMLRNKPDTQNQDGNDGTT